MRLWTFEEMSEKVRADTDNQDVDFIDRSELLGYANEAIDDCEALIHKLYQDYFLTKDNPTLVAGTQDYAMPSDIFANKIKIVLFDDGSRKYEIKRLRDLKMLPHVQSVDDYKYMIFHDATLGYRMRLLPAARAASSTAITRWYYRNAGRLVDDDDTCDIPEFMNFILQHMKMRCYEKEGHPNVLKAIDDVEKLRILMETTLAEMTAAESDSVIPPDFSFYDDFDSL